MSTFTRNNPYRAYPQFPFRSLFPNFWEENPAGRETAANVPAINIAEDEKGWQIEVSAPGFKKQDFTVKVEKDTLTIGAEYKEETGEEKRNYSRREFRNSTFSRSFRLQQDKVNEDGISAVYENGILTVTVPKKEAEPKKEPKKIEIA